MGVQLQGTGRRLMSSALALFGDDVGKGMAVIRADVQQSLPARQLPLSLVYSSVVSCIRSMYELKGLYQKAAVLNDILDGVLRPEEVTEALRQDVADAQRETDNMLNLSEEERQAKTKSQLQGIKPMAQKDRWGYFKMLEKLVPTKERVKLTVSPTMAKTRLVKRVSTKLTSSSALDVSGEAVRQEASRSEAATQSRAKSFNEALTAESCTLLFPKQRSEAVYYSRELVERA
eukprot:gene9146-16272_t